jgi:hypothetical protein
MNFDLHQYHRRSIRLQGYDYSLPGAYFITIVSQGHEMLFGEIIDTRWTQMNWNNCD